MLVEPANLACTQTRRGWETLERRLERHMLLFTISMYIYARATFTTVWNTCSRSGNGCHHYASRR